METTTDTVPRPTADPTGRTRTEDRQTDHPARAAWSERGASLVEYALLVALIAVVMVGAVTFLGDSATGSLDNSGSSIVDATS